MKRVRYLAVAVFATALFLPAKVHAQWVGTNPVYFNAGNVGIGTTTPVAPLQVLVPGTGVGSAIIGGGVGAWEINGNSASDGKGYGNISNNAFLSATGWQRRSNGYEAWDLSSYMTNNNTGYFRVFHANPGTGAPSWETKFTITSLGWVGIKTDTPKAELAVNGTVLAKSIIVSTAASYWPDYVFAPDYNLPKLNDVETYINENKHLPGIDSADEIAAKGQSVGDIQVQQMRKIEELTLYVIDLQKQVDALKK